jgi:hypothetical protein
MNGDVWVPAMVGDGASGAAATSVMREIRDHNKDKALAKHRKALEGSRRRENSYIIAPSPLDPSCVTL